MLMLLPLVVLLCLLLILLGRVRPQDSDLVFIVGSMITAAAIWGFLVIGSAEILSLFHAINQLTLSIFWVVVLGICLFVGFSYGFFRKGWDRIRGFNFLFDFFDWVISIALVCIVLILLVLAWISPPNNVDSLLYHMTRVVHWAQSGSLGHYATAYSHQNFMPLWAETAILQLRVLWGSDRPANLVQWSSLVGSVLGIIAIANMLGAGRKGQLLSAAFALSVPMGILQTTSTQNDLVTTFWLVCLSFLVILGKRRALENFELVLIGLVLGLGMLTKVTFYIYAAPFMLWFFLYRLKRVKLSRWALQVAGVLLIAGLLNAGYWARNLQTYGNMFGSLVYVQRGLSFDFLGGTDIPGGEVDQDADPMNQVEQDRLRTFSAFLETSGMRISAMVTKNAVTPSSGLNAIILHVAEAAPSLFGEDFERVQSLQAWNHEDTAGNPLHLLTVVFTFVLLLIFSTRGAQRGTLAFALACLVGYLLIAVVISNGPSLDGIRFQLPFFILWAPVVGTVFTALGLRYLTNAVSMLFLLFALPWVFLNNTRPIIGLPPWPTRTASVFQVDEGILLYNTVPAYRQPYGELSAKLRGSECRRIGLRLDSHDLEYLIWWEMEAPQSGFQLQAVDTVDSLRRYLDPEFKPCAILCTTCGGRTDLKGLERIGDFANVALFTDPDFWSDQRE